MNFSDVVFWGANQKIYVLIVYVVFGLLIALCPALITEKTASVSTVQFRKLSKLPIQWLWTSICFAIGIVGMVLISGEYSSVLLLLSFGLIAVALSLASGKVDVAAILPNFLGLSVSATILWWRRQGENFDLTGFELLVLGLITYAVASVFTAKEPVTENGFSFNWLIPYALLAAILSFSTSILHSDLFALWHHWGAYIGSAEMLLTGAAVFHDFPIQYGLGPTALIASFCSNDCWRSMYFVAGFITFSFSVLIAALALAFTRKRWPAERFTVLALCLVVCFFWASYAPNASSPMVMPSVSGLRFLPAVLMTTYLFFTHNLESSKSKMFIAHGLWVFGALWSPESAFYVTCVWWPYYMFVCRGQGNLVSRFKTFVKASMTLLLIAVGLGIVFTIIYYFIYHKSPTLYGYLAYAINPPGPLPINPHGGVWYFIFAIVIGVMSLVHLWRKSGDTPFFRHGFLVLLLSYSVFSYFLGRSHDNNLLNIMPFILLVLLHAISTAGGKGLTRVSIILVAALLGWLPVFGWHLWHENANQGKLLSFDFQSVRDEISFANPLTQSLLAPKGGSPADAARAIEFIHQRYGELVTVLDSLAIMVASRTPDTWSAVNGFATYLYIPSERRREFLSATAASLNRPGWLIVLRWYPADEWLADFDSVYDRTHRLEFGDYYAIRFSPKGSTETLAYKKAQTTVKEMLADTPVTSTNIANVSLTYINNHRLNKAVRLLKSAILIDPYNAVLYNNLCFAYALQKKYNDAAPACLAALRIDPNFQLAKNNLAWVKTAL